MHTDDPDGLDNYDPERAFAEHDPALEPYASMARDQILALMLAPGLEFTEWAKLQEFLYDKMTVKELQTKQRAQKIACFLMDEYGTYGNAQACFMARLGGTIAALIAQGMPARGAPQECN